MRCLWGGGGGGWGGGRGVDSVRDGVLPDPLTLSDLVDLPVIVPRPVAALAELHGGSSDQFFDVWVPVGLWSRQCRKLFGGSW